MQPGSPKPIWPAESGRAAIGCVIHPVGRPHRQRPKHQSAGNGWRMLPPGVSSTNWALTGTEASAAKRGTRQAMPSPPGAAP